MHRFFIDQMAEVGELIYFGVEQGHHVKRVLRLREGAEICAFNGQGWACRARLVETAAEETAAVVLEILTDDRESPLRIVVAQGLAKGERMELVLQKSVELGAAGFQPFYSRFSVVELSPERAAKKCQRWQSIAREACKQCRRNVVPPVAAPVVFSQLLERSSGQPTVLLYEQERAQSFKKLLQEKKSEWLGLDQTVHLVVGPEGGFAVEELEQARQAGWFCVGLGPRILRTETAGLAALAAIMYEFDAWEG